ncbi:DUF5684 domain-containing protein [Mucilaginibacter gilvus]|uniref:Signal peptidase I n=1 Tax=Mucilaginibacter gilvus TaxID=2305909 RepID=A0A444MJY9_9SPHI|nr:DUF5684 domain-containing protein [Mucilaginibacter gilvus]RWY49156.1 hypothetical protein EPL05_17205 [Mucilaginibacter gilvus]
METYDAQQTGVFFAFFAAMFIPIMIVSVIILIAYWKIFEKAGKPGWAAIVPIYNIIVLLEIVGKPLWWILLLIFPCTSFFIGIWLINLLSKSFGQSEGFTLGLIFLPFVFFPLLGFGNYQYIGPAGAGFARNDTYDPSINYKDPLNPPQA